MFTSDNGGPGGNGQQFSGVDLLLLEQQDRGPLKVAITAAILLHLLLFWWNIWPQGAKQLAPVVREPRFIIYPVRLEKRKPEKKPIQNERVKKVPIPDPSPHEIEPLFELVADLEPPLLVDNDLGFDRDIDPPLQAPPAASHPYRDHLVTAPPVALEKIKPEYPPLARMSRVEGLVILEAVIRKDGTVGEVTVLMAPPGKLGFDRAAVAALRQWTFRPGEMHGRPVDVIMTLTVNFRLDR